ncbi:MAG: hypothetical protein ACON46_06995 [Coraliomargaritaceae bacterium]
MNRNFLTLLGLAWGLSIAIAYYLGRHLETDTADSANIGPAPMVPIASKEKTSSSTLSTEVEFDAAPVPEEMDTALDALTLRENILSTIADLATNPQLADELRAQLTELASINPLDALELSDQITSPRFREQAVNGVLREWATSDPMAALQWIDANSGNLTRSVRNGHLAAAYRGFAEANPQAAFTQASQLSEGNAYERRLKSQILGQVVRSQVENGELFAAKQSIEQMADSDLRSNLLSELVDVWADSSPVDAAAYLSSLGDAATSQQKSALARSWSRIDPAAAAAWLDTLGPEDPSVSRAARDVIREWARYDLGASAEWLNSRPASPELDRAVASYTYHAVQEDPASAMAWADSVDSDRMKGYLQMRVAGAWREDDPTAFQSYLDSSDLSDERKEELKKATSWNGGYGRRR